MAKRRTSTRGSTVVPLARGQLVPSTYAAAVDRYLTAAGISPSSARVYRVSLTTWCWLFAGDTPPTGSARRRAVPPSLPLIALDDPAAAIRIATAC